MTADEEVIELRKILVDTVAALGGAVSMKSSLDFLRHVPEEARLVWAKAQLVEGLKQQKSTRNEALVEAWAEIDALKTDLDHARTYKGLEGYPCPLCTYRSGIFVESCEMHRQNDVLKLQVLAGQGIIARAHARLCRIGNPTPGECEAAAILTEAIPEPA